MRFALAALVLPALALAGALEARDDKSIIAALNTVESKLSILNSSVTAFNGDLGAALGIQGKQNDVSNALQAADKAVNASKPLTEAQSGNVAGPVITLVSNTQSVLSNLVSKKPQFQKAILGLVSADFLVESDLKSLKKLSDQFAKDLIAKLTPDYAQIAPTFVAELDKSFDDAIKAFAT